MLHGKQILILDDDENSRMEVQRILDFMGESSQGQSHSSWITQTSNERKGKKIGLILVANAGESSQAYESIKHARDLHGPTPVVAIGDSFDMEAAKDPNLRKMVVSHLKPPLTYNVLNDALHQAQRYSEAHQSKEGPRQKRPPHLFRSLVGNSPSLKNVRKMMAQVAESEVTVLIEGESGTGKEVVARNLHRHSARRDGPFVPVNCGAIPAELLESELFGHEKGAFTGAVSARAGRFELAENGTLFLDEIGDMPLHMQVKLLRVLQEKTYDRVGGTKTRKSNVRIIAATHRDLPQMIEEEKFREDLFYRLNVFPIEMPALRDRTEDMPLLINELVARLQSEERGSVRFNSQAIASLCHHSWPGNVRELANLVERMAILHPDGVIGEQELPAKYRHAGSEETTPYEGEGEIPSPQISGRAGAVALLPENDIDLKAYISGLEQSLILQALESSGGVVARAAERLTIRRTTLVEKIKKYGLQ